MTQDIYGPAATRRAGQIVASGNIVLSSEVSADLANVVTIRTAAAKCGAGQVKKNLNGEAKRNLQASAMATLSCCWLCGTEIDLDDPARSFEKDSIVGGKDHLYSIASIATAHAFCNRVRGNLQAMGYDLSDIVAKANALPMPVRANGMSREQGTADYSDLL